MKLLRAIRHAGAPDDYLYARIRYRRSALDPAGQGGRVRDGDPCAAMRAEYNWVYGQMNGKLRKRFLPLFEYFELKTLVIALRYLAVGDAASLRSQLQLSLLHPQLHKLMLERVQVAQVTAGLERALEGDYPCFDQLTASYLRQGPGGLEQRLIGGFLQYGITAARSMQVRDFLRYLLDMRNLQSLYKHLRWQVPLAPPLLNGGNLALSDCEKVWAGKSLPALLELMRLTAKSSQHPAEGDVEDYLLDGLTRQLEKNGREPLQEGLVIDYLWRCQLNARQQGLQLAAADQQTLVEAAG